MAIEMRKEVRVDVFSFVTEPAAPGRKLNRQTYRTWRRGVRRCSMALSTRRRCSRGNSKLHVCSGAVVRYGKGRAGVDGVPGFAGVWTTCGAAGRAETRCCARRDLRVYEGHPWASREAVCMCTRDASRTEDTLYGIGMTVTTRRRRYLTASVTWEATR